MNILCVSFIDIYTTESHSCHDIQFTTFITLIQRNTRYEPQQHVYIGRSQCQNIQGSVPSHVPFVSPPFIPPSLPSLLLLFLLPHEPEEAIHLKAFKYKRKNI